MNRKASPQAILLTLTATLLVAGVASAALTGQRSAMRMKAG